MGQEFGKFVMPEPFHDPETPRHMRPSPGLFKDEILYHASCPRCIYQTPDCVMSTGMYDVQPRWFGIGPAGKVTAVLIFNEKSTAPGPMTAEYSGDCIHDGALLYTYRVKHDVPAVDNDLNQTLAEIRNEENEDNVDEDRIIYKWDSHPRLQPLMGGFRVATTLLFSQFKIATNRTSDSGYAYQAVENAKMIPYMGMELILKPGWSDFLEIVTVEHYNVTQVNKYIDWALDSVQQQTQKMILSLYNKIPWTDFVVRPIYPGPPDRTTDSIFRESIIETTVPDGYNVIKSPSRPLFAKQVTVNRSKDNYKRYI